MDNMLKKKLVTMWIVLILIASTLFLIPNLYFSNATLKYHTVQLDNSYIYNVTLPYSIYPSQKFSVTVNVYYRNESNSNSIISAGILGNSEANEFGRYYYFNSSQRFSVSGSGYIPITLNCSFADMAEYDSEVLNRIIYGPNQFVVFLNMDTTFLFFSLETLPIEIESEMEARIWFNASIIMVIWTGVILSACLQRKQVHRTK